MTKTLDDIATAIAGILAPLAPIQRTDLINKISAASIGGEMISVGDKTSVDALHAAREALIGAKRWPTPIQCAAAKPAITDELKRLQKMCRAVGYTMAFDSVFSLADFDKQTAGRDPLARATCKRTANLLGLCA
jgi:hypothetical protein